MKIKTVLTILLVLATACLFTACGGGESDGGSGGGGDYKTLADIYAAEPSDFMESYDTEYYACTFTTQDGVTYRAEAATTEDIYNQCDAIPFEDEDHDAKVKEILGPLEITRIDDISFMMPSDEETQALIGKTAGELQDEGFDLQYYTSYEGDITVSACKDYVAYTLTFSGDIEEDQENWRDLIKDMELTDAGTFGFDFSILEQGFELPAE